ncbi:MAG: hypothetical protein HRT45_14055 [Bdellovibrionales bacterium]|nr:hypothetical protein [Bdellovibrionales bacterium]
MIKVLLLATALFSAAAFANATLREPDREYYRLLVDNTWCRKRYVSGEYQIVEMLFHKSGRFWSSVYKDDEPILRISGFWNMEDRKLITRANARMEESSLSFFERESVLHMTVQSMKNPGQVYRFRTCDEFE